MNFPRPAVADGTSASRPAQLRGLSPDQTLVLVNGKRWHSSAVVNVNGTVGRGSSAPDLNTIPLAAIERVEVLRDGASAQYGSDAIAGVINIILKKGASGGVIEAGVGQTSRGDGSAGNLSANFGVPLGEQGCLRVTAEQKTQGATNRAGPDLRNPLEPRYGQITQLQGDPRLQQSNLALNAALPLNADVELYALLSLSQRDTDAPATWRTAYTSGTTLRSPLYPQGFLPNEAATNKDISGVFGIKGRAAEWRWDTSLNYGSNEFSLDVNHSANLSLGTASPTSFYIGKLKNTQTLANFDAAREIDVALLEQPLTLALGGELRQDQYQISAGEKNSYVGSGAQGFAGFQSSNAGSFSRHSVAIYADVEAELTRRLRATVALRHENFSDFGSVAAAKVSGRFELTPELALRAAASNGFRAPSLAQQNYTISTSNLITINGSSQLVDTGTFGVATAAAKALGAKPLQAEKSRNLSLGAVWQPAKNVSLSIDAYQIEIDNRILYSGNLVLPTNLQSVLAAQGVPVAAARYFTNALDTRNRGVDVVGTWALALSGADKLAFTLGYNRNNTAVTRVADNPAVLTQNNLILVDRQSILRATVSAPKDKLSLAADYSVAQWLAHAQASRYGSFASPQNNAALDQTYGANVVLDAALSYRLGHWTLTGGIDNLTNQYPDQVTSAGNLNSGGTLAYSTFSPYGFNGRYYYAKAAYAW
ncbi:MULTISPECIES: TonB-dependent receptor [unclassified Undibacterium]|uniref:TonB-dependent receptor n=1 Tax=unclassified Undibacterium TaxID=2630295 RepID=UPI002AC96D6F|nr:MULTISPECIES: TonB-dependent receptor [unclassified Undibacterium]MEB0138970.1 TonB-dependent receptor [Undibacterium sp. CCC2.1]MEB0171935.1 TonB-dependent receptor [Undibacterium sp. CCC1.1]MEB0175876.1 TonB-dependent receptor [Undibacterium sp. CCC3.4]MEB0215058.1 TonB-dependent receptor [Undibacterium sp. 5I2]WPX45030.1 TonB-dependent receptor [Undibacterium sp. CCC3.4]